MPESNGESVPTLPGRASNVSEDAERARILQPLKEAKGVVGSA